MTTRNGVSTFDYVLGEPPFASADKFNSASGWPSIAKPVVRANIRELPEGSHGMICTEVRSVHADHHLGNVLADGPVETRRAGLLCIHSAALPFIPLGEMWAEGYGAYLNLVETMK
ncbi:Peptide methionine sulfoxide reductase MsrB [compost metagenome]